MLVEGTVIDFLVHRAVEKIEKSQRPEFQRRGLYIQLSEHNFDAVWFGLAAVVCLLAAGRIISERRQAVSMFSQRVKRACLLLGVLVVPALYCAWYYLVEFHRLSPEIAGSGFAFTSIDAIAGFILAATLVTAGAYQCARVNALKSQIKPTSANVGWTAFHESAAVLILFACYACSIVIIAVSELVNYESMIGTATIVRYLSMLVYPTFVLQCAIALAIFQLCWMRWKSRSMTMEDVIFGMSGEALSTKRGLALRRSLSLVSRHYGHLRLRSGSGHFPLRSFSDTDSQLIPPNVAARATRSMPIMKAAVRSETFRVHNSQISSNAVLSVLSSSCRTRFRPQR